MNSSYLGSKPLRPSAEGPLEVPITAEHDLESLRSRAAAAWEHAQAAIARQEALAAARRQVVAQELMSVWPFARIYARSLTMPVIEQAKGIMMAQTQCGPDEAFDLLRQASQRSNVPVRELAARVVRGAQASSLRRSG